jgi:hypothetical protein
MNKALIINLLEDNGYFSETESKLFHSSFRKGWRKLTSSNISWSAVEREHGVWGTKRLTKTNNIYTLSPIYQFKYDAPLNVEFLGAAPTRNGEDY